MITLSSELAFVYAIIDWHGKPACCILLQLQNLSPAMSGKPLLPAHFSSLQQHSGQVGVKPSIQVQCLRVLTCGIYLAETLRIATSEN